MEFYNKIPVWENKNRLKLLYEFKELVDTYFNNVKYDPYNSSAEPIENETARGARKEINLVRSEVRKVLHSADIRPLVRCTPPPSRGGYIQDIDITANIFNLRYYKISHNNLLDFVYVAIGKYSKDSKRAWIRTFNPCYWVGCVFDYIAGLPFALLDRMGFDSDKAESSIIGRCIKGLFYLIEVFAALLAILYYLGYIEQFKELIQKKPPAP